MAETKTPPEPLILVVEDEELLWLHAADLLEEHGFRVVEARNADTALKVLESRDDVRLLFTDIQMPGARDGMDLAREVHARWPNVLLVIACGPNGLPVPKFRMTAASSPTPIDRTSFSPRSTT